MRSTNMIPVAVVAAALTAGCEVEKTKDGDVTLPSYEVSKTRARQLYRSVMRDFRESSWAGEAKKQMGG